MKLWQTGNVGPHNINKLEGQAEEGYASHADAASAMLELKEKGNWELNQKIYRCFTIMELFYND